MLPKSLMLQSTLFHKAWSGATIIAKDNDEPQADVPAGRKFTRQMSELLQRQAAEALAMIAAASDPQAAMDDALAIITDDRWRETIAEVARPFIEDAIDIGGQAGMARLPGVSIGFDVSNPAVQRFVDGYTVRLASSVQDFTRVAARDLLGDGLANGESVQQLAERIRPWAEADPETPRIGSPAYRAEMIARTESARAYVAGEQEAWKQSEVVAGKQWLLAAESCEFCEAAAAEFNNRTVPLGEPFFKRGHVLTAPSGASMTLDYSDTDGAPLHPGCRCDLIPVLKESE